MARAWRIEYEGAYYHLLSLGNERRDIFLSEEDCGLSLDTIGECGERFEIDIFSYVMKKPDRFDGFTIKAWYGNPVLLCNECLPK